MTNNHQMKTQKNEANSCQFMTKSVSFTNHLVSNLRKTNPKLSEAKSRPRVGTKPIDQPNHEKQNKPKPADFRCHSGPRAGIQSDLAGLSKIQNEPKPNQNLSRRSSPSANEDGCKTNPYPRFQSKIKGCPKNKPNSILGFLGSWVLKFLVILPNEPNPDCTNHEKNETNPIASFFGIHIIP
jgi:hypothetical protein